MYLVVTWGNLKCSKQGNSKIMLLFETDYSENVYTSESFKGSYKLISYGSENRFRTTYLQNSPFRYRVGPQNSVLSCPVREK